MKIEYIQDSITNISADVLVNAANAKGYMGGWISKYTTLIKGVAESIQYVTKGSIEKEAKRKAKLTCPKVGDVFITSAANLEAKFIFHAVTVPAPGKRSSLETVSTCLNNLIKLAQSMQVKSIALPALGTGTGRLPLQDVAQIYREKLHSLEDIQVIIVDPSGKFINVSKSLPLCKHVQQMSNCSSSFDLYFN